MGQAPEELRQEIEDTRSRMTDTVDAIGYKADVKARAGDYVDDKKSALAGKAHGVAEAADSLVSRVTGAVPNPRAAGDAASSGMQDAREGARRAAGIAQSNPLALAIGGAAAGLLLGLALPSTRVEDERIGEVADDVKARVAETGQEAIEHGKQVAQETAQVAMQGARDAAQTAAQTARDSGQEHASELKETAQEQAQTLPGVGGGSQQGGQTQDTGVAADTSGIGAVEQSGPVGGPVHLRNDR